MCWRSQWGSYRTYRTYRMCWGSQWAAAAPWRRKPTGFFRRRRTLGEETYLAFFGRRRALGLCGGTHLAFWVAAPAFLGRSPNPSRISPPENLVLSRRHDFPKSSARTLGCVSGDSPHTALVGLHLVKAASVEGDRLVVHVDPRAPQLLSVALRNSHFRRRAIVVFHPDPSSREGSESDRVVRLADHV